MAVASFSGSHPFIQLPCKSKDHWNNGFSQKTILLVGNLNHPKLGTIIFKVFDFQARWWFQIFFIFTPKPWGNAPIWRAYFSSGLEKNHQLAGIISRVLYIPGRCEVIKSIDEFRCARV